MMVVVTTQPLSVDDVIAAVRRPDAGAIAVFIGVVRNHAEGREVVRLEYDAYVEMAEAMMRKAGEEAARRFGVVTAAQHRTGSLELGEVAVVIAVSSAHRAEAFDACRFVIEELKRDVPIWKTEIFATEDAVVR